MAGQNQSLHIHIYNEKAQEATQKGVLCRMTSKNGPGKSLPNPILDAFWNFTAPASDRIWQNLGEYPCRRSCLWNPKRQSRCQVRRLSRACPHKPRGYVCGDAYRRRRLLTIAKASPQLVKNFVSDGRHVCYGQHSRVSKFCHQRDHRRFFMNLP